MEELIEQVDKIQEETNDIILTLIQALKGE
jgi:hypothetical protein